MVRQQHQCMDMSLSKLREIVKDRKPAVLQFVGMQRVEHNLTTEQQHFAIDVHIFFVPIKSAAIKAPNWLLNILLNF